jgi:hypothetical protein
VAERQDEPGPAPGVTCAGCGTGAGSPPITWSVQHGSRGATWLCERCTRENLRSIEGRLDEAWW